MTKSNSKLSNMKAINVGDKFGIRYESRARYKNYWRDTRFNDFSGFMQANFVINGPVFDVLPMVWRER